jgi:hypothetical protein
LSTRLIDLIKRMRSPFPADRPSAAAAFEEIEAIEYDLTRDELRAPVPHPPSTPEVVPIDLAPRQSASASMSVQVTVPAMRSDGNQPGIGPEAASTETSQELPMTLNDWRYWHAHHRDLEPRDVWNPLSGWFGKQGYTLWGSAIWQRKSYKRRHPSPIVAPYTPNGFASASPYGDLTQRQEWWNFMPDVRMTRRLRGNRWKDRSKRCSPPRPIGMGAPSLFALSPRVGMATASSRPCGGSPSHPSACFRPTMCSHIRPNWSRTT